MNRRLLYVFLAAGLAVIFVGISFIGCSNKNSGEACRHQLSLDLDHGNYDAVIASPCTDAMSLGAAYLGKAGFDVTSVVDSFITTGTGTTSSVNVYMGTMISKVTNTTFTYLDFSATEYSSVPSTAETYSDAQFYLSIVDSVKALALLKSVIDVTGTGSLNTSCDTNVNNKADEIDGTSCAFLISGGSADCSKIAGASIVLDDPHITVASGSTSTALYRGLITEITGTGSANACPSPNQYKALLYSTTTTTSGWAPVATISGSSCQFSDNTYWPCPVLNNDGSPMDLVQAVDTSLTAANSSLNSSLTTTSDVSTAITDLQTQACPDGPGTCTSTDIANYLQTY